MIDLTVKSASERDYSGATLIYADPPYNTGRDFGQFNDKWRGDEYFAFMREWLGRVKKTADEDFTLIVHVDPNMSHYVKVLMDEIFGKRHFLNEVIWSYNSGGAGKRSLAKKHDTLLVYGFGNYTFNILREPYATLKPGEERKNFHTEGRMLTDVWTISILSTTALERTGYPTQKPSKLLERIVEIWSNEGDLVIDPFLGSGTTAYACSKLNRKFSGSDINPESITVTRRRLPS